MLSFSTAVSPELRALMEKERTNVADMLNVKLTAAEQVWSRQLYYMLSLSTSGRRRRRDCRTCQRERVQWRGRKSLNIRHFVRKYEEQSGESVTDKVQQAVFQAGIKDAAIRDHLALNSFDEMAAEVSTVARTRSENDIVPMDVSVLKGKGGRGKDGKDKEGKGKEGKAKTKAKDDRDKFDPKSSSNKFKNCFYCDKVGHVRVDCRKKKRDDEERRNMSAQNRLNSSRASMSPPGFTNITTNTSGASSSSLRQLTIPSYVSDDDFHSPMRIFCLERAQTLIELWLILVQRTVLVRQITRMNMKFVRFNERFNSRRPVVNSLNIMVRLVPYMAQDSVVEITYQVTDVEGPVVAVSSMNDGGKTVVFSPQGTWVCDETPLKPAGSIELKREKRADSDQVQRMMALRHEQPVEQVERIAGKPAIEEKRQGIPASADSHCARQRIHPSCKSTKTSTWTHYRIIGQT